jgi:hypothetical protein
MLKHRQRRQQAPHLMDRATVERDERFEAYNEGGACLDSSRSKETVRIRKRPQGSALSLSLSIIPLDGRKEFIGSIHTTRAELVLDSSSSKETVRIRKRPQGSALSKSPVIPLDSRKEFIGSMRPLEACFGQFEFERDSSNSKEAPKGRPYNLARRP